MLLLYEKGSKGDTTPRGQLLCCQAKETPPLGVRSFVAKQRIGHPLGSDALLTLLSELGKPDSDSHLWSRKNGKVAGRESNRQPSIQQAGILPLSYEDADGPE